MPTQDQPRFNLPRHYATGPMWGWFGLTYSSYLVLPRSLMCGMPEDWQARMVALLDEMRGTYEEPSDEYVISLKLRDDGRFRKDPLANYRRIMWLPYKAAQ